MKKTLFFALLLAGVGMCVFAQNGVIREFTGDVELKRAGASAFVPAKAGDKVVADTVISTGFKSTAIIEVGSSTIAVRPLTRLSLAEIQTASDTETLNLNLQTGRVKVDVKPPAGTKANFTVQSPSATASVRGTSFEVDSSNLRVFEGTVAFQGNRGMTVLIPAGMTSYVNSEGKAVDAILSGASTGTSPLRFTGWPTAQPPSGGDSGNVGIIIDWEGRPSAPPSGDIDVNINWPNGGR